MRAPAVKASRRTVEESPGCLTVLDASGRIAANIDVEENGTGRGWAM
jgi:hypothetical protein